MDETDCGISDIPDEVLLIIFSNLSPKVILSKVVHVCERWKNVICSNDKFWKRLMVVIECDNFLNFSHLNTNLDTERWCCQVHENEVYIGENDLSLVSNLSRLKLTWRSSSRKRPTLKVIQILDIVKNTCTNIKFFEFAHCFKATPSTFLQLLNQHYTNIVEIKFGMNFAYTIPYKEFSKFEYLTTLISYDYSFKKRDLLCIADCCPQLKRLWLLSARDIRNGDVLYFLEKKKSILEEIGVDARLGDSVLNKVKECTKLKVLFVGDATDVTENGLLSLTQSPWIKYISLHHLDVCIAAMTRWITLMEPLRTNVIDLTGANKDIKQIMSQNSKITFDNNMHRAMLNHPYRVHDASVHWMYATRK